MEQMELDFNDEQQIDDNINQEEAWFYHVIAEFQDIINRYGCAFVLSKLSQNHRNIIKEKLNG